MEDEVQGRCRTDMERCRKSVVAGMMIAVLSAGWPARAQRSGMPVTVAVGSGTNDGAMDMSALMYAWGTAAASPAVDVVPATNHVTVQQSFAVTVKVASEAGAPDPTGTVTLYAGGYAVSTALGADGEAALTVPGGVLAAGTDVLTASYVPDPASAVYYDGASGQASVTVYPEPAYFSIAAPALTLRQGAATGNTVAVTVHPYRGFTGLVRLTAAITGTPRRVHDVPVLSFGATNPVRITGATPGRAMLTITTTAGGELAAGRAGDAAAPEGGAVLAGLLLLTWPAGRKRRGLRTKRTRILYLAVVAACSLGLMGCGVQAGSGQASGTTPGDYTVTITGVSQGVSATGQFIFKVR